MASEDPYRVLGVTAGADEAAIRAAYLALMKRFHPDQGGTDLSRAQRIAAAYHLLATPARRAAHDRSAAAQRAMIFSAGGGAAPAPRRRQTGRLTFFLLSAATAGLLYAALNRPAAVIGAAAPASASAAQPAAVAISVPVAEEVVASPVTVPEPELVEVSPSEPQVPTLVAAPLRTNGEEREQTGEASAPGRAAEVALAVPRARPTIVEPAIDLGALERHQNLYFDQSLRVGDEQRRARLLETRAAFLRRLEGCGDDLCRRDTYLQRNQEIAAIMQR